MPALPRADGQIVYERFRAAYPDLIDDIAASRRHRERQLSKISVATVAQRRDLVRRLLRDRRVHLACAYDAIRRSLGLRDATPESVRSLAASFNAFAPIHEKIATRDIDKGSGRRRVQDFGPRRRMHQALVADILRSLHPPLQTQTLFNGGMPAALRAVATAYSDGGFTHGVEVDIVDFYGSVAKAPLAGLLRPLPDSVVDNVVWDLAMREDAPVAAAATTCVPPTSSPPTGLSLGSGTSPIVGERIVAELLAAARLPDTITYADNLFVMGRSEAEVRSRLDAIRNSAALLDVGELELRESHNVRYDLARGFTFLKREGYDRGHGIEWRPGQAKINQYMISAVERPLKETEITAVEARVRHWRRSYEGWPDGDALEAEYLAALAVRRFYADGNASNLTAAIHAVVIAHVADPSRGIEEFVPTEGDNHGTRRPRLLAAISEWINNAQHDRPG